MRKIGLVYRATEHVYLCVCVWWLALNGAESQSTIIIIINYRPAEKLRYRKF